MNAVKMVANYIRANDIKIYPDNNDRLHDLLCRYHAYRATDTAKKYCRDNIIMQLFFLLPHILSDRNIPQDNFDDALQNMVLTIMHAIDNYDIRRGSKFTAYLVGYFKDALSNTYRDTQVVRSPVYKEYKPTIPIQTNEETSTLDAVSANITLKNKSDALTPSSAETTLLNKELINFLEYAVTKESNLLTEKEIFVITHRYGIFGAQVLTLEHIANMFQAAGWNGTKVWVFQVQQNALRKLRKYFATNKVTPLPN